MAETGFTVVPRSWRLAGLIAAGGGLTAVLLLAAGGVAPAVTALVGFGALAILASPLAFPGVADAGRHAAEGGPVVYWRPGCPFCVGLRLRVGRDARRASWVNIWTDPAGAAAVRAVTGGDETVPTVVWGSEAMVNPDPRQLRQRLRAS